MPLADSFAPILDAAADGIVIPHVESPAQAREAVDRLRLMPAGTRGYGPRRLAVRPALDPPGCVVQIETTRGVDAAPEIARVDGIEAIVIGCADLSHDLGEPLRFDSSRLQAAVATVGDAAEAGGVTFGVAGLPGVATPERAGLVISGTDIRIFDAALAEAACLTP